MIGLLLRYSPEEIKAISLIFLKMEIEEVTNKQVWEDFLLECQQKTFLQSWNWGEFQKSLGNKIWRFGIFDHSTSSGQAPSTNSGQDKNLIAVALVIKHTAKRGSFLLVPHGPVGKLQIKNYKLKIKEEMPELPGEKITRFVQSYNLNVAQAVILIDTQSLADYFEEAVKIGAEHNVAASKIANALINKKFDREKILPADLIKTLLRESEKPVLPEKELESAANAVISKNPGAVDDYKNGKTASLQFLLGQIMKETSGKIDPQKAREILLKKL